jgi:hypothetical protein
MRQHCELLLLFFAPFIWGEFTEALQYRSFYVRRAWLAWSWTFIPLRELTQTLAEISHSVWLKTTIL